MKLNKLINIDYMGLIIMDNDEVLAKLVYLQL